MTGERRESTHLPPCRPFQRGSLDRTDSGRSAGAAGTGLHAPFRPLPTANTVHPHPGWAIARLGSTSSPNASRIGFNAGSANARLIVIPGVMHRFGLGFLDLTNPEVEPTLVEEIKI